MRRLLLVALLLAAAASPIAQNAPADLIFHNAKIYTADDAVPRAEAIAVRGDRIAAVGTSADVLKLKGPTTRVVDARGAAIVPGLIDSHGHFTGLGASLQVLRLRGTKKW
jgi:predicted amidohydrolase YtcJ